VIVNGAWGFAATNDLSPAGVVKAAQQAAAIAKANAKVQTAPVQFAKAPGYGEVSWRTPIRKNAMEVPIKDKADLLLGVNAAATAAGASFVNSMLFLVNEQKYFASTDGSYIDQDVHRIWAPMTVTAIDKASGKFRTRDGLSSPMGLGFEYLDGDASGKTVLPNGVTVYGQSYDMREDAIAAAKHAQEKLKAPSVKPGKYDLVLDPSHTWLTIHESAIRWSWTACSATRPTTPAPASPRWTSASSISSTAATRSTSSPTRPSPARSARWPTTTRA
jgi:TldD protein